MPRTNSFVSAGQLTVIGTRGSPTSGTLTDALTRLELAYDEALTASVCGSPTTTRAASVAAIRLDLGRVMFATYGKNRDQSHYQPQYFRSDDGQAAQKTHRGPGREA